MDQSCRRAITYRNVFKNASDHVISIYVTVVRTLFDESCDGIPVMDQENIPATLEIVFKKRTNRRSLPFSQR